MSSSLAALRARRALRQERLQAVAAAPPDDEPQLQTDTTRDDSVQASNNGSTPTPHAAHIARVSSADLVSVSSVSAAAAAAAAAAAVVSVAPALVGKRPLGTTRADESRTPEFDGPPAQRPRREAESRPLQDTTRAFSSSNHAPPPPSSVGGGVATVDRSNSHVKESLDAASILAYRSVLSRASLESRTSIDSLLSAPTLRDRLSARAFQQEWVDGAGRPIGVQEFCTHKTIAACNAAANAAASTGTPCTGIHLVEVLRAGLTSRALGDCSYLNSCSNRHCRFVHYEIAPRDQQRLAARQVLVRARDTDSALASAEVVPAVSAASSPPPAAEWIRCDIRTIDVRVLGQFDVIMMDPPWRIHMDLPYDTMGDDEMLNLDIAPLQQNGVCCVWVVSRAVGLARRCLTRWGYADGGEVLWVKLDQLHRLRRLGRTGHWLNHAVEHCLIGVKGRPPPNRHLDCDVIVSQPRETSRKPDEVYGVIERLMPNARRLEIFGRQHNTRAGWLTIGNQLDGIRIADDRLHQRIRDRYGPDATDGNWLGPPAPT